MGLIRRFDLLFAYLSQKRDSDYSHLHDDKVKILIDFTQIPTKKAGVGVYALNLIKHLSLIDDDFHCYVLVQDDDTSLDDIDNSTVSIIKVKARLFRNFILRALLEQLYIPCLAFKLRVNVVHSLHYSFPLFLTAKKVVTVHDMSFFKYSKLYEPAKVFYFKTFIKMSSLLVDKIICVSESTRKDYVSKFDSARNKTEVIYHACSNEFTPNTPNIDDRAVSSVKSKYGIDSKYFLFIGTLEPRKNITAIIKAFDRFNNQNSNYKLVMVGKKGWYYKEIFELVKRLDLSDRIIFTGFIPEKEKPSLLVGATAFIYPSIYEGFGIPVLEAIACGTPTVTSNVSSIPEVAGDAALLVNPENSDEIFVAINKIVNDPDLRRDLKMRSLRQAEKFSWNNTAKETLVVYKDIAYRAKH
jgi:glycosyltransferase involved in cell wall biosynthesis